MTYVPALDLTRFVSFTTIAEPIDGAVAGVAACFQQFVLSRPLLRTEEPFDLARMYLISPPPGGRHAHKVVLYSPRSAPSTTVLITNRQDGWSSLSHVLATKLGATQSMVTARENGVEYPKVIFRAWTAGQERVVLCMRDSHAWVFRTVGEPLPFEDLAAYAGRPTSKRLTREMALRYVKAMGWDTADPDFWATDRAAIYFEEATLN